MNQVIASCVTGCHKATFHIITPNGPVCKTCLAVGRSKVVSNADLLHEVETWMWQNVDLFDTATELAEAAFAEFPTLDTEVGFELAHDVKYAEDEDEGGAQ